MPRRAAQALLGAAIGMLLLVALWFLAFHVGFVERADQSILSGFADLRHRPHVTPLASFVARLCNPSPYLYLAAVPVLVALVRRRGWLTVAICAILLGANETTQLLKPLLAHTRAHGLLGAQLVGAASWPSGHATAAMSLALCCALAAPSRWRPWVAAAGAVFAVAVCFSFLSLAWHYPTDVVGGFLVAGTWTLLGIAAMLALGGRSAERQAGGPARVPLRDAFAPLGLAVVAAGALVVLVTLVRPRQVIGYAHLHRGFVIGAVAIAGLALALAAGLMLVTTRLGSGPAARAAPGRRWRPGPG